MESPTPTNTVKNDGEMPTRRIVVVGFVSKMSDSANCLISLPGTPEQGLAPHQIPVVVWKKK